MSELLLAKASAKDHGAVRLNLIFCIGTAFVSAPVSMCIIWEME